MPNQWINLVERREVYLSEKGEALDLGAYKTIVSEFQVHSAGSAGSIYLQHAAVNEEDAFTTLGNTVLLDGAGITVQNHTDFLRYVRFATDASVADSPVASLDIVAKEY